MSATKAKHSRSNFDDVQAHYDISNEFFALFQDESRTYSSAFFEREDMTLAEAQLAKLDLSLSKLDLKPGMTLLDVGCGWGSTMLRAIEKYDVNVVGVTLSEKQFTYCQQVLDEAPTTRTRRVYLRDWADFNEPVDRIVTIEALEHFGFERYEDFFKWSYNLLPDDGLMMVHSLTGMPFDQLAERGIPLSFEVARFVKFIMTEIFPGARIPSIKMVQEHSENVGFEVTNVQSLQSSFARTFELWAEALEARRDEAITIQSEEVYDRYMKYLTGCVKAFRVGYIDVNQFSLKK